MIAIPIEATAKIKVLGKVSAMMVCTFLPLTNSECYKIGKFCV